MKKILTLIFLLISLNTYSYTITPAPPTTTITNNIETLPNVIDESYDNSTINVLFGNTNTVFNSNSNSNSNGGGNNNGGNTGGGITDNNGNNGNGNGFGTDGNQGQGNGNGGNGTSSLPLTFDLNSFIFLMILCFIYLEYTKKINIINFLSKIKNGRLY